MPLRALRYAAAALAASSLVLATSGTVAASSDRSKPLPGSGLRQVRQARVLGPVAAAEPLDLVVTLKPRNADLLASLAARTSARAPLDPNQVRALFFPSARDVATVRSYFAGHGFHFRSARGLSLSFAASAGAAEDAFGVDLSLYRDAHGHSFRAPSGPLELPAPLVNKIVAVDGLDTFVHYHPASALEPRTTTTPCASASFHKNNYGGYLPADLAGAYDYQQLVDGGADGDGEAIAFVEFSNYTHIDISTFKNCFGLTNTVVDTSVNGGTSDLSGAGEVVLDVETALGAAPGLDTAYVYMAPGTTSMATMINQIVSDQATTNAHIISISWGLCEQFLPISELAAVNDALQLAAVAGMSVFSASGDNGSSDCLPDATGLAVDDPAAQPYATGVGGTTLDVGGSTEIAWGRGGGGLSALWPMPSWQSSVVAADSSGDPCNSTDNCREVPDVALDADPATGYVIYCSSADCGHKGWITAGGTSAGAPLLAGVTADANEYSLANGGDRLGFANPFLYDRFANGGTFFHDVTAGTNDYGGLGKYSAGSGYDLATGLGSLDANLLAQDLALYSSPGIDVHSTSLSASPTVNKTVTYGGSVAFSGDLTDTTDATPIAGRVVWVELDDGLGARAYGAVTDASGHWSRTLSTAISRKTTWRAYYVGDDARQPAESAAHLVFVKPKLVLTSTARLVSGHYVIRHGVAFTTKGTTKPHMGGASVILQWRSASSSRWHSAGTVGVTSTGTMAARSSWGSAGRYYMRWRYSGSTAKPWLAVNSPARLFVVS